MYLMSKLVSQCALSCANYVYILQETGTERETETERDRGTERETERNIQ